MEQKALVTGASTGIGRSTALEFSKAGYFVYLVARSKNELEKTKSLIEKSGGKAQIITTDLSNIDSVNNLIKEIKNMTSTIDAIINIAGIWHGTNEVYADKKFQEFGQKIILDTYSVGFTAPTLIIHGLLPLMNKKAKIVNLSGTFENGAKGWLPYFTSKRAIEDLTIGLAQELEEKDIQVNCISPSDTATKSYEKYFPQYMDEAINPKEIADKIVELCTPSSEVTGKIIVMKKGTNPFEGFHK